MAGLVFCTSAKTSVIQTTIGRTLQSMHPTPPHKFVGLGAEPYLPAPDELALVMGKNGIETMARAGLLPKNRTADSLRGKVFSAGEGHGRFMVSLDPSIVEIEPGHEPTIAWDVQLIARLLRTESLEPVLGDYQWVDDFSALIARIETEYDATGKPVPVAADIETLHLSPFQHGSRIIAIGFTDRVGYADLLYVPEIKSESHAHTLLDQIRWLLTSPKVRTRGANFKFDMNWIQVKWNIACTNFAMDTVLVGSILNENRSNSLKNHVRIYSSDLGGYDDAMTQTDMENMHLVPKDKMRCYLGGDVDGTLRVSIEMLKELEPQPALARFYIKLLHPGAMGFQTIERQGICIDRERFSELQFDLETTIADLGKKGLDLLPARMRHKFADNLSLGRPAILSEYFFSPSGLNLKPKVFTAKSGKDGAPPTPSTAKNHLEMFFDVPEAKAMCSILDGLNQAKKALSTYVVGFLSHVRADGRLHPTYFLHKGDSSWGDSDGGTITGRLSAKDPAIQTVPTKTFWASRIKSCFISPLGYRIVSADYSQGELRIAACLANEPAMIEAYLNGIDLHAKTGAQLANMPLDDFMLLKTDDKKRYDYLRGKAKPANFGIIYGISPEGYRAYAWNGYRVSMTITEAEETVETFFKTYPRLPYWHEEYKKFAHQNGYVVSPLGRIRHLPHIKSPLREVRAKAERQAVNSPDQATLSDLMVWAIGELNRSHPQYLPFAMIHDAAYWYVPEDQVTKAVPAITATMEGLPIREVFGWDHALPFTADASVGNDMGHLDEWKFPA